MVRQMSQVWHVMRQMSQVYVTGLACAMASVRQMSQVWHVVRQMSQFYVGVDRYVFFRADTDTDYYRSSRPITDILNRYTCLV